MSGPCRRRMSMCASKALCGTCYRGDPCVDAVSLDMGVAIDALGRVYEAQACLGGDYVPHELHMAKQWSAKAKTEVLRLWSVR